MKSTNIPEVKLGIVAVSRDCFPIQLSEKRRAAIVAACQAKGLDLYEAKTTVENEKDMEKAVAEVTEAGCNALTVFLGNFGPETPETLIAKFFNGPCRLSRCRRATCSSCVRAKAFRWTDACWTARARSTNRR